ncbi:hypothetical protein VM57_04160 [Stenotrophomonas maltophilia]|uniref:Uncharacterized protein n=1 Tax=Stenotrophomonas maltophilia TaxID=40324 RepID=A0A0F5ZPH9_STEMA|nr:hypothetical protein VM57_04160 [Stenotrophomonas maltophilia]
MRHRILAADRFDLHQRFIAAHDRARFDQRRFGLAKSPRARDKAALNGAGSIWNSTSPALTFAPSSKVRRSTMPATRARTSATRTGSIRPGSSAVSVKGCGWAATASTGTGAWAFASPCYPRSR